MHIFSAEIMQYYKCRKFECDNEWLHHVFKKVSTSYIEQNNLSLITLSQQSSSSSSSRVRLNNHGLYPQKILDSLQVATRSSQDHLVSGIVLQNLSFLFLSLVLNTAPIQLYCGPDHLLRPMNSLSLTMK